jgi:DNA-directed RNA polymerase specialized sigma subunit
MAKTVTPDQVVAAAKELGQDEFTREDLAQKLGVEKTELKQGFRKARQAGELDKVREDDAGTGHFRLTNK